MESINNYKLKDFLKQDVELIKEYVNILQYSLAVDTENLVFDLTLKEVDYIKTHLFSNDIEALIEIISTVQNIEKEAVYNLTIVDFYGIYNSIKEQVETIIEGEQNALTSTNFNIKWEQVKGSERLARFGIYNILDTLADGDVLKYESIFNLPYAVVMQKLVMNKIKDDLQQEMNSIPTKKN